PSIVPHQAPKKRQKTAKPRFAIFFENRLHPLKPLKKSRPQGTARKKVVGLTGFEQHIAETLPIKG
ncbi:hypothetical protein, partial [Bifidobacterium pseudolongum]|uniref:hypothetical protein n=1 Tax=Bifidobacterium pseudolongum TaxID=1694 RepID=UPI001F1DAEE0